MRITVDGAALRYEAAGEGEPVLLVHGFPLSGALWAPTVERLGGVVRAIVPDLRGHGASEVSARTDMARYADDLAAVLEDAGEHRPVTLVGLSMGGYVALEFCRRFPDRVRGLVLVDTRADADSEEGARGRRETAARVLREGSDFLAAGLEEKLFAPAAPQPLRGRWRTIMAATPPVGVAAALFAMAARPDSFDTLRALHRPVLVVVGEHDAITPLADARRMAEAAGAQLEVVPGAGHMTPVEAPERFAELLRAFVGSLPPG